MAVRKLGCLMVMVVLIVGGMYGATASATKSSTAQSTKGFLDSHYKPGTFAVNVGIDLWAFSYGGLGVYPGAEFSLAQYAIENQIPFDFGLAVQGFYYTYGVNYYSYSWSFTSLGVGVFGTVHFGPKKSMPVLFEFLERVDFHVGLGLSFQNSWYTTSDPYSQEYLDSIRRRNPLGFATIGGVTYFLTDTFGIRFDGSYYGFEYGSATLCFVLKL
ncbi:hypothetical protein [Thermospira aquatica]|uniref:Outer membrane protein beta-barrel domain-containing protein n=1 Tax=Thermospira aquatica TaxID=2828656 RepID=A0AAX3BBC0_9SPIR|nr:hypothetical protein [Thermospira aquatica]URA09552.1 hypothetical protein KDW03_08645 [Thermospira aquatica]